MLTPAATRKGKNNGRFTHGYNGTKTYIVWTGMKGRCNSPGNCNFHNYGARGIVVCERWQRFENFLADMGECPAGMSIDRINNDGNYEPGNCRWATPKEQMANRRGNRMVTAFGETKAMCLWLDDPRCVVKRKETLKNRLDSGLDPETAITQPVAKTGVFYGT